MRSAWVLFSCVAMLSCGDGMGDVFGDGQWQVRCPVGLAMCPGAGMEVDVFGFDGGEEGVRASCDIRESGDQRIVSFSLGVGGDPLLAVNGIVTSVAGGNVVGDACRLTVIDDGNTYGGVEQGRCGANPPSAAQPCQLGPIAFNRDGEDGPEMTTSVYCVELPSPANPSILKRDITRPRMTGVPASIRLINCDGI